MTDKAKIAAIADGLSDLEREWVTEWQGPAGAAFNIIAGDLRTKGLLASAVDWSLNPLGLAVRSYLQEQSQ